MADKERDDMPQPTVVLDVSGFIKMLAPNIVAKVEVVVAKGSLPVVLTGLPDQQPEDKRTAFATTTTNIPATKTDD